MSTRKALTIKRINQEMKEIAKSPLEGIGIVSIDNDPMKYAVNICIMQGIYEGYCLQLLLSFTQNYPICPPQILIFPDQAISDDYHAHIYEDYFQDENGHHYKNFCFDLFDGNFIYTPEEYKGWNPHYSISFLLLQVQYFLSDPDIPISFLPNKTKIKLLMNSKKDYKRTFKIKAENKETIITHTWENPYPKMYFKNDKEEKKDGEINTSKNTKNDKDKENEKNIQIIKENLTCFLVKLNYIENQNISLGYPIVKVIGFKKNKIELFPIPELLTYEGYKAQIEKQSLKLNYYFDKHFKSTNNNYWVPIYIDEDHYLKNRKTILNTISKIKDGESGTKENNDFSPKQIFEIFPIILSKIITGILSGQSSKSYALVRCFFHFVLLFRKLSKEFEKEFINYLSDKLHLILQNRYRIKKSIIPDINNFFILLCFYSINIPNINNEKMAKIRYRLFEEWLARQINWILNDEKNRENIIELMKKNDKNYIEKEKIIKENTFKECIQKGYIIFKKEESKEFEEILEKEGMLKRIILFFFGIYDLTYEKEKTIKSFKNNFKNLFNKADKSKRYDIYKNLVELGKKNLIEEFFELSNEGKNEYSKRVKNKLQELSDNFLKEKRKKYLKKTNEELLSDEDYLNNFYQTQNGNKLLLIFFVQKKIEENGFLNKLEKNYGVDLEVDDFIKEMKEKLSEIKSYSQFFQYIDSEYCKNKSNAEMIRDAYKKTNLIHYIRDNNNNSSYHQFNGTGYVTMERGFRGRYRGRGRGRGRRRGY